MVILYQIQFLDMNKLIKILRLLLIRQIIEISYIIKTLKTSLLLIFKQL